MHSRSLEARADHSASQLAARRRLRKFLTYYRPHLPLLAADLFCAIVVAGTALALPVCASWITRRLGELNGADATAPTPRRRSC